MRGLCKKPRLFLNSRNLGAEKSFAVLCGPAASDLAFTEKGKSNGTIHYQVSQGHYETPCLFK